MSGKAYIFGRKDVVALEDDEENSEIETTMARTRRPRRGPRKHSSSQFIEEDIEKGETVQSLAIRYSCTASEIRRINNLYSDLDFHALTKVKIPIRAHSILTEPAELENRRKMAKERSARETDNQSSTESENCRRLQVAVLSDEGCEADEETVEEDVEDDGLDEKEKLLSHIDNRTISFKSAFRWKDPTNVMFKKLDRDLQKMREKNDTSRTTGFSDSYHGHVEIPMPMIKPMVAKDDNIFDAKSKMTSVLIALAVVAVVAVLVVVLIFFFPLVYTLYKPPIKNTP